VQTISVEFFVSDTFPCFPSQSFVGPILTLSQKLAKNDKFFFASAACLVSVSNENRVNACWKALLAQVRLGFLEQHRRPAFNNHAHAAPLPLA